MCDPNILPRTRRRKKNDLVQEFQQRAKANGAQSGPASAPGRLDAQKHEGMSVEDSWDLADDYTPFPSQHGAILPSDAITTDQWAIGSNHNMATSSELWNRVSQVRLFFPPQDSCITSGLHIVSSSTPTHKAIFDNTAFMHSTQAKECFAFR